MNYLRLLSSTIYRRPFILYKIQCCKHGTHPLKFIEMQNYWRQKDGVPKNWELIYKAPMDNVFNYLTTYITLSTGLVCCVGIDYGLFKYKTVDPNAPIYLGTSDVIIADNIKEFFIYITAFIMFHAAVKILISKYVIRMYKNGDTYLAIFRGHFVNRIKKHEFDLKDFKRLKPTYFVTWGESRFSLDGKHGIILESYFKTPHYFNYLLTKKKLEDEE